MYTSLASDKQELAKGENPISAEDPFEEILSNRVILEAGRRNPCASGCEMSSAAAEKANRRF